MNTAVWTFAVVFSKSQTYNPLPYHKPVYNLGLACRVESSGLAIWQPSTGFVPYILFEWWAVAIWGPNYPAQSILQRDPLRFSSAKNSRWQVRCFGWTHRAACQHETDSWCVAVLELLLQCFVGCMVISVGISMGALVFVGSCGGSFCMVSEVKV